jgi:hypothetical protein
VDDDAGPRHYVNWRRSPRTAQVALALPERTRRPVMGFQEQRRNFLL